MILSIVVLYYTSTLVSSKPLGNAPNIVKKISENLTVIKNVSWDFFKVYRSNNTNNSNDKNLQWSSSNGQERLKWEVSSQNDIPCQHRMQEITLFKDSYEIISKAQIIWYYLKLQRFWILPVFIKINIVARKRPFIAELFQEIENLSEFLIIKVSFIEVWKK